MRCRWRELLALGAALTAAESGAAQGIREIGVVAMATSSDPALAVAGAYAAFRTSGRARLSASLGAGISDGELAWRGELLGHFLLSPEERRKAGFYFAGGVAAVEGPVSRGYLVLTLGVEERPRAGSGWAVEGGFGGGFRLALGYRWRHFSGSVPQQERP
jgi:hypothetical protein